MKQKYKLFWYFEWKRLFPVSAWVCIFLLSLAFYFLSWKNYKATEEELCYREVVQEYRGIVTPEKIAEIMERADYYQMVLDTHYQTAEDYARGRVSDEEFKKFMEDYYYAKEYISGWDKLKEHALRYQEQKQKTYFLYDIAWEKLFKNKLNILFIFLMILCFVPYFYKDMDVNWKSISETYIGYKKIKRKRLLLAIFLVLILQILWIAGEAGILLAVDGIPDSFASACSLLAGESMGENLSLQGLYILKIAVTLAKRVVDILFLKLFSDRVDNKMLAAAIWLVYLMVSDTIL